MRSYVIALALLQVPLTHAALTPRDLDGNPATIEALYDAQQNLTWLWNWEYPGTGRMTWEAGLQWADQLTIGGVAGWALPTVAQYDSVRSFIGEFDNVRAGLYWTSEEFQPSPWFAYVFEPLRDRFDEDGKGYLNYVTAVRSGDTSLTVPEPGTGLLAAVAVAALFGVLRRNRASAARQPSSSLERPVRTSCEESA